jgi:hypothetical protein
VDRVEVIRIFAEPETTKAGDESRRPSAFYGTIVLVCWWVALCRVGAGRDAAAGIGS